MVPILNLRKIVVACPRQANKPVTKPLTNPLIFVMILMMKLTKKQRENLGRVFFNTANFIFAIVILGSFISKEFDIVKLVFGVIFWIIFIIIGTIFDKGE